MWVHFLIVYALTTNVQSSLIFPKFIYPNLPNYVENSENEMCNSHSELYKSHLKNFTYWAHEMLDSSAKFYTGILRGSTYQLGNYQQCLSIDAPFTTKYCAVSLNAKVPTPNMSRDPFSLHFDRYESVLNRIYNYNDESQISRDSIKVGLCIPDSCASNDLEKYLTDYIADINSEAISYNVTVSDQLCQTKKDNKNFDAVDISFCILTALIILLLVLSYYGYNKEENLNESIPNKKILKATSRYLQVFSTTKNFTNLTKYYDSNPAMDILNGMRSFTMFVVIIGHRCGFTIISEPLINYDYVESKLREPSTYFLYHTDLFVDSFFVFGGILAAYLTLLNKNDRPHKILLRRYLRLTPSYAFIIFYVASLFYYTGSGPFWNSDILQEVQDCRNNWWTNLLYINNYVNVENMCLLPSWYLPCDFHYFIIGLLVVLTFKKNKRLGLVLLVIVMVVSIIIPFVITVINNLPPMLFFYKKFFETRKKYPFFSSYVKSHLRATPYIIGLITGFLYYHFKDKPIKISKKASYALTIGSLVTLILSLLSGFIYYQRIGKYSAVEAGAAAAFHRLPWAIGTAVFMITTSYGQINVIRSTLSWKLWIPISKLSFGAYLLHFQFVQRTTAAVMIPKQANAFDALHSGLGDIFVAYFLALLLYLGIEAPVQNIYKMQMKPKKKTLIKENAETRL